MVYNLVSSSKCIGRIFDRYSIDYSGFIPRVPGWISSAISEIGLHQRVINDVVDGEVVDYKCRLPVGMIHLRGISYLGYRLTRYNGINETVDEMPTLYHTEYGYSLKINENGVGYIITNFEDCDLGDLRFYITKLPVAQGEDGLYWPLVPDMEEVWIALDSYIITRLVYRGHNIPPFSLAVNNPVLNPALKFNVDKDIARIRANKMDSDTRQIVSDEIRTFLSNNNYHNEVEFNNENIIL